MDPIQVTTEGGATFGAIGNRIPVKAFKLGDYPDKGFSCDEQKAKNAIARHVDAPILINHRLSDFNVPDIFGLGRFVDPYFVKREDGDWIDGFIEPCDLIAQKLRGRAPKVSVGWTKDGRIGEVSFVLDPRIEDAGLLAAFGMEPEPVTDKPEPDERRGPPMSIFASIKEKLGFSDAQMSEMKAEFSNGAEVEQLKTRLAAAETKTSALETENAGLKTQVHSIGTGVGATFAKSQGDTLAAKYLAERKIGKDEVAETVAAFEAAYAGATFGAEEPAGVKALKAMLDKRPALADPTVAHFGGADDPNGRKAPEKKAEPFDAVANFNAPVGR